MLVKACHNMPSSRNATCDRPNGGQLEPYQGICLAVDDEPINLMIIDETLKNAVYQIDQAEGHFLRI